MRWHAQCPYEAYGPLLPAAGSAQGATEQTVRLTEPDTGEVMMARRIVLPLATRTRNGDAYRERWQIETHFQRLTEQLHCEPTGLDMPRAALFAFAMAVIAGNALALVTAALQAAHGEEAVQELSYYYFVLEVSSTWKGMAVAVPDEDWAFVRQAHAKTLAVWLLAVARQADMGYFRHGRRGPKKPPPKKAPADGHTHVSNKRVIEKALHTPIKRH